MYCRKILYAVVFLFALPMAGQGNAQTVVSTVPAQNGLNVELSTNILVTFDIDMDPATINAKTFIVHASLTGLRTGIYSYNSDTKTAKFDPDSDFKIGEVVSISLTTGIQAAIGDSLAGLYVWSFGVTVKAGSGGFLATSTPAVGNYPSSVVGGDFDADGDLDLAAANSNSNDLTILRNIEHGVFTQTSTPAVGENPNSVTAGDFDGDGDLDLAAANSNSNDLTILTNNGHGAFTQTFTISVADPPTSISGGDFDADGDLDLAVTHDHHLNAVSILSNAGNGVFTQTSTATGGNYPCSLAIGDLDGDGDLDLAVANPWLGTISILTNDGHGVFTQTSAPAVGENPNSVTAGDFDGDGDLDLAAANSLSDDLTILTNDGHGAFIQTSTPAVGTYPSSVTAGDFDGDGDLDLAVANLGDSTISILTNFEVFERFSSAPVKFSDNEYFALSNGRLFFHGNGSDETDGTAWVGGSNPGGEYPAPEHSNYFENFEVSAEVFWEDGADNYPYGLAVCAQENSFGTTDDIYFAINKKGYFLIGKNENGNSVRIANWWKSSLIAKDGQGSSLSIKKGGPYFHFYINKVEVARRIIEGFHGGGIAVWASHRVDASFDDFAVRRLSINDLETDGNNRFEDFGTGPRGFSESEYYSISSGRYVFRGDRADTTYFQVWIGGFNPGGWAAEPDNTNYFEDFTVSVDTYWEGGANNYFYGLIACVQKNPFESPDYIRFMIINNGYYVIQKIKEGEFSIVVDWTPSALIKTGGQMNTLAAKKAGSDFYFYINNTEVEHRIIAGFSGGALGVEASQQVDASFDNFSLSIPGTPPTADAGADQSVNEGDSVSLDGSNSYDTDDGISFYQWYQISGPPVILSDSRTAKPMFTAPDIGPNDVALYFQLTVTDHSRLQSSDIALVGVDWVIDKGDIDKNGKVDLSDAIIAFQVLSGINPTGFSSDFASSGADVNGDGKIGLEEGLYILQDVSGLR